MALNMFVLRFKVLKLFFVNFFFFLNRTDTAEFFYDTSESQLQKVGFLRVNIFSALAMTPWSKKFEFWFEYL